MAANQVRLAYLGELSWKTAAAGAYAPLKILKDLTIVAEAEEVDATARGSGGFKQFEPGLKSLSFEWDMLDVNDDLGYEAVKSAFLDGTSLFLQGLDATVVATGGEGWVAECKIFKFTRDEKITDRMVWNVVAKPCYPQVTPFANPTFTSAT